jgi:hypothetical protein
MESAKRLPALRQLQVAIAALKEQVGISAFRNGGRCANADGGLARYWPP